MAVKHLSFDSAWSVTYGLWGYWGGDILLNKVDEVH